MCTDPVWFIYLLKVWIPFFFFFIFGCMTSNFKWFSFSTLQCTFLWRIDTISWLFEKAVQRPVSLNLIRASRFLPVRATHDNILATNNAEVRSLVEGFLFVVVLAFPQIKLLTLLS